MLYRYRLFLEDGSNAGEAHYAVSIKPDEVIWTGDGRKLHVLDVVPVEGADWSFVDSTSHGRLSLDALTACVASSSKRRCFAAARRRASACA